jgi:hypothetical protein
MFFVLLSLALALLACLRGWFPWAFIVFAIPFVMPELSAHGFDLGGRLAFSVFGVPGGGLSLAGLALMTLFPLD